MKNVVVDENLITLLRGEEITCEKISELATLIPEWLENGSGGSENVNANEGNAFFFLFFC